MSSATEDVYCTKIFDYVIPVEKIANPKIDNLARLGRLDLRFAFTKIALWRQEQFRRILYIDADVIALKAPDELFNLPHPFAAAPDIGWPDIFNSGVMLLTPNAGDYRSLSTLANSGASFDGADQGLFNEHFREGTWHRLSFTCNCTPSSSYQYEPAYRHFRNSISLVHFVGREKPWQQGRRAMRASASAVYRELLGKWWAVYDKHYKASQTSALGQISTEDQHLQSFVKDEDSHSASLNAPIYTSSDAQHEHGASRAKQNRSSLATNHNKNIETLADKTPATSEKHRFEPPQSPWDATRSAPPATSKAEAGGFPSQRYEMSSSGGLFKAPQSYPEPPKDFDYALPPRSEPAKPPPIFPWEHQAKKPTRVFAEPPPPAVAQQTPTFEASGPKAAPVSSATHRAPVETNAPSASDLDSFSRLNAWDNVTSIDQYVRAVRESQNRRGGVQALQHDERDKTLSDVSFSGAEEPDTKKRRAPRQESLILTDFPTEVERPSLPVTPAPVRRPTFWGEERDEAGELPAADGVPNQSEWDPHERLEQLRRSSVAAAEELPQHEAVKGPPLRAVPETSAEIPADATNTTAITSNTQTSTASE
ncbi:MAG: hypothetical protein Q9159_007018 [Coniocarpon cinnabarinum]